jgi:hypothetical protein
MIEEPPTVEMEIKTGLEALGLLEQCVEEIEDLNGGKTGLSQKVREFLDN